MSMVGEIENLQRQIDNKEEELFCLEEPMPYLSSGSS